MYGRLGLSFGSMKSSAIHIFGRLAQMILLETNSSHLGSIFQIATKLPFHGTISVVIAKYGALGGSRLMTLDPCLVDCVLYYLGKFSRSGSHLKTTAPLVISS